MGYTSGKKGHTYLYMLCINDYTKSVCTVHTSKHTYIYTPYIAYMSIVYSERVHNK